MSKSQLEPAKPNFYVSHYGRVWETKELTTRWIKSILKKVYEYFLFSYFLLQIHTSELLTLQMQHKIEFDKGPDLFNATFRHLKCLLWTALFGSSEQLSKSQNSLLALLKKKKNQVQEIFNKDPLYLVIRRKQRENRI